MHREHLNSHKISCTEIISLKSESKRCCRWLKSSNKPVSFDASNSCGLPVTLKEKLRCQSFAYYSKFSERRQTIAHDFAE